MQKANPTERERQIAWLRRLVDAAAPVRLRQQVLSLAVWEVPIHVQVQLAATLAAPSLPRIERNHPDVGDMVAFLRDPSKATPTPSEPEIGAWRARLDAGGVDRADLFLFTCAADVAEALDPAATSELATSLAVHSAVAAIAARAAAEWLGRDPDAAKNEELLTQWIELSKTSPQLPFAPPLRPMRQNPDAMAEERRAWNEALSWLRAHIVARYPAIQDRAALARHLRRHRHI